MIGRRGAMRDRRRGIFLKIVRRQHVVGRRDEGLEEPPGAARDQPQRLRVGGRSAAVAADLPGDRLTKRATAGEAIQSAANGSAIGQDPCRAARARQIAASANRHAPAIRRAKPDEIEPATARRLRRGDPFEQMAAGDDKAPERPRRSRRPSATPDRARNVTISADETDARRRSLPSAREWLR